MKRLLMWLVTIGVIAGTVLVGWELISPPGPLRKVWRAYKFRRNPLYEARVELTLVRPISDEELAAENQLLDSMDMLMPLVRDLKLNEVWQTPDETAAMVRLAQASNLRRGSGDLEIHLSVTGTDRELIGELINPLARSYVEAKRAQAGGTGSLPDGP
jgi:hypothetical protein